MHRAYCHEHASCNRVAQDPVLKTHYLAFALIQSNLGQVLVCSACVLLSPTQFGAGAFCNLDETGQVGTLDHDTRVEQGILRLILNAASFIVLLGTVSGYGMDLAGHTYLAVSTCTSDVRIFIRGVIVEGVWVEVRRFIDISSNKASARFWIL